MAINATPQYNALDGIEIAKLISKQFYEYLLSHRAFAHNLTYPKFEWTLELMFCGWPQEQPVKVELSGSKEGNVLMTTKPVDEAITVKGSSSRAPDQDRDTAGIPKPRVTQTPFGLVDKNKE